MKLIFKIVFGLFLAFLLIVGALFVSVFVGKKSVQDGQVMNGHGITVDDGFVASYLLAAGDGTFALIDCGNHTDASVIKGALTKFGAGPAQVRAVFLTHGHPDHIAGCDQFAQADVYAFPEDIPVAAGEKPAGSPMGRLAGVQSAKTAKVNKSLTDGQEVQVGELTVRAYRVPGHTQGSAGYLARGVLYLGDSATVTSDGRVVNAPWLFTDDQAQNAKSIAALVERLRADKAEVTVVAFSHTGPVDGLDPLAKMAP